MSTESGRETAGRTVTTQDLSWLIEQSRRGQLDLDPPYQRRSVWTPRDRRYFMDTVFKNYPSPPVYLHKTIDLDTGDATYHVVDGKQRISTVLLFLANKVYLPLDFGDARFAGKRWRDLAGDDRARARLWNYRVIVEEIDDVSATFVREVFERLNKNSRKLTAQELRHARFDGWLITFLEDELTQPVWKRFRVHTTGKEKRMTDVQNLAELALITRRADISGFSQDDLDEFFAELDDIEDENLDFEEDDFVTSFHDTRDTLDKLDLLIPVDDSSEQDKRVGIVSGLAQPFTHLYTLWSYVDALGAEDLTDLTTLGQRYRTFMERVHALDLSGGNGDDLVQAASSDYDRLVVTYKLASVGATTDLPLRRTRLETLSAAMQITLPGQGSVAED